MEHDVYDAADPFLASGASLGEVFRPAAQHHDRYRWIVEVC